MSLAQQLSDARADLPTNLGSAELRDLDAGILRQSIFSARMINADAVQAIRTIMRRMLASTDGRSADNAADARLMLKQIIAGAGYNPASGFPGQNAPPAEPDSLQDLLSDDRLNLIIKTQEALTQGAAKNIWGNDPSALQLYPAWELVRVEAVELPRGERRTKKGIVEVPSDAWNTASGRWAAAAEESGDDDAAAIFAKTGRMVARKDSPIWQALGAGAGGYRDTLGNDYEPFAFGSGMGRVEVSAKEFAALGGDARGIVPMATQFGADQVNVTRGRFDADFFQELKKEFQTGQSKFKVKLEVVA